MKQVSGQRAAILVASGFDEDDMTQSQRALQSLGIQCRLISMDPGLINSWKQQAWGLNFAADAVLSASLAADFDILVIPSGARSIEKLMLTAHTRRFVGGFMDAQKPVIAFDDAVRLIAFAQKIAGLNVCAPDSARAEIELAGGTCVAAPFVQSGNLLTGVIAGGPLTDSRSKFIAAITDFLASRESLTAQQRAAA
jgi:protease I